MTITSRRYRFSASHQLSPESQDPRCRALHGHHYEVWFSHVREDSSPPESITAWSGQHLNSLLSHTSGEYLARHLLSSTWDSRSGKSESGAVRVSIQETRKNSFSATHI